MTDKPTSNVIGLVPKSDDVDPTEFFARQAELRRKEFDSYVTAGFDRGEAFSLLQQSVEFVNHMALHDSRDLD